MVAVERYSIAGRGGGLRSDPRLKDDQRGFPELQGVPRVLFRVGLKEH